MNVNSMVSLFSGAMIMVSLAVAHFMGQVDLTQPTWLWLTLFVGANLFQMGFTGFCPAKSLFKIFGARDSENRSCCS